MPDDKPPRPPAKVVDHPSWTALKCSMVADALEGLCEAVEEITWASECRHRSRARSKTPGIC